MTDRKQRVDWDDVLGTADELVGDFERQTLGHRIEPVKRGAACLLVALRLQRGVPVEQIREAVKEYIQQRTTGQHGPVSAPEFFSGRYQRFTERAQRGWLFPG